MIIYNLVGEVCITIILVMSVPFINLVPCSHFPVRIDMISCVALIFNGNRRSTFIEGRKDFISGEISIPECHGLSGIFLFRVYLNFTSALVVASILLAILIILM